MSTAPKKYKGIALNLATGRMFVHFEWAMAINALTYPVGMNRMIIASLKSPKDKNVHTRDEQRERLAEKSVELGAEFIMSIDDDTVPPPQTINELVYVMRQHPNAAIVGGIYPTRSKPEEPLVWMELGGGTYWDWTVGDVFPCAGLGAGCMMIRTKFLETISKPWFKDTSVPMLGQMEIINGVKMRTTASAGTDDLYLCKKVADAGYEIWAHGGVLPQHIEDKLDEDGDQIAIFHKIPENSGPFQRYLERQRAAKS